MMSFWWLMPRMILFILTGKIAWQHTGNYLNFMFSALLINLCNDGISVMSIQCNVNERTAKKTQGWVKGSGSLPLQGLAADVDTGATTPEFLAEIFHVLCLTGLLRRQRGCLFCGNCKPDFYFLSASTLSLCICLIPPAKHCFPPQTLPGKSEN